ncbi:DNA-apurinic or apyrimidinic site lyase [Hondaea fermentalgiana]|uniref:DNA-apurinic or apyrimidinic site lyase n=1 Tax=Hondaea fermentalgiana TaxID=2315210 RepID=A0A2R5G0S8_9STRA|nr:DNA-apurinic or apyrimidinic site lyase [Hondaea fermentalgiana]|eukprot:GBG23899.1 DNA-apurinic or apyrimidinic site lyase [Hondaea fermentalgiana]
MGPGRGQAETSGSGDGDDVNNQGGNDSRDEDSPRESAKSQNKGPAGGDGFLHLLSWNVAAWQTTLELIVEDEKDVRTFWDKHAADIVCLQEVKITASAITAQSRKIGAFTNGFDTFWAPCFEKDPNRKGMQGVATWAREGLTLRADTHALRDPDLDAMGRCLFTEHHEFGLFNVYAPAGANGTELRMRFYNALRAAMQRERAQTGKPIILCGDLNLAAGPLDVHYMSCRIDVDGLLSGTQSCPCGSSNPDCCRIKSDLQMWWPAVLRALKTRTYLSETTRSSVTNEARERFRMAISVPVAGGASANGTKGETRQIKVGKLRDSTAFFEYVYDFSQRSPAVNDIVDLLKAVGDINWGWREALALSKACGQSPNDPSVIQWFQGDLCTSDNMLDTFRELYPHARNRFTCWDQYTNRRYENCGARIDYFVMDRDLLPRVAQREHTLRCGCGGATKHAGGIIGHAAAKCAATAAGRFQPAAFSGGGLQVASVAALQAQFGAPHNGIIYTPPKYSDHVAVSLCLRMQDPHRATHVRLNAEDRATRRAQPHKKQRHITTFFASGTPGSKPLQPLPSRSLRSRDAKGNHASEAISNRASQEVSVIDLAADCPSTESNAKESITSSETAQTKAQKSYAAPERVPSKPGQMNKNTNKRLRSSKAENSQGRARKRKAAQTKGQSTLKSFLAPSTSQNS